MSGIAGMSDRTGHSVERTLVHRMTTALRHRGPDAEWLWLAGPVGFGHCMLRTTPESVCDTQPLSNASNTVCLTLDGRLDNRHELQTALKAKDINCPSVTDAELVLGAYTCWGEGCVEHLLGDFAFALWDGPRQTLFCARDHIGVKPLYYYVSDRSFLFGSEIKALLSVPHVPHTINEARIADYLVTELEGIDTTSTFYQAIFRLPPAHILSVCGEHISVRSYWSLDPTQEISYRSQAEYTDAFRDVFSQAVECRLRGVSPVACMLSGGLDSSSIVGVARDLLGKMDKPGTRCVPTFSAISTEATNCVETSYIQTVLSLDKLQAHTVRPDQVGSFLAELEQVPVHTDDLFDNLIILPQLMYIAARRQGYNVLLDGVDGDLVASQGGSYLAYLLRAGQWRTAFDEARERHKVFDPSCSVGALLWGSSLFALHPFVPARVVWLRRQLHHRRSFKQTLTRTLINPDFARRIDLAGRLEMLWEGVYGAASDLARRACSQSELRLYPGCAGAL
jgi:asparagine synthase (glutamine-hydrolysing)